MSPALKGIITLALDLFTTGKLVATRADFVTKLLPALYKDASDIPAIATNIGDLKAEILALKNKDADEDLVAFVITKVSGVTDDTHAQKIIAACLTAAEHLVSDIIAIEEAIKAPVAAS